MLNRWLADEAPAPEYFSSRPVQFQIKLTVAERQDLARYTATHKLPAQRAVRQAMQQAGLIRPESAPPAER